MRKSFFFSKVSRIRAIANMKLQILKLLTLKFFCDLWKKKAHQLYDSGDTGDTVEVAKMAVTRPILLRFGPYHNYLLAIYIYPMHVSERKNTQN